MKRFILFLLIGQMAQMAMAQGKIDSLKSILAREPNNIQVLLGLAISYHDLALKDEKNAVKNGMQYIEKAVELDSTNALVRAYYGSLLTLKARDASMPWKKIQYTRAGFTQLDRAIALEADNLDARLIRAMNSTQVPSFLGRLDAGIADFEFIVANENFASWPIESQAYIHYHLGLAYDKKGRHDDADNQFRRAIDIAPSSKFAQKASAALE